MLTVDASQLSINLLNDLVTLFQGNRYVLTVRRPVHWLRSMIEDSLRRDISKTWMHPRRHRFEVVSEARGEWVERLSSDEPIAAATAELSRLTSMRLIRGPR